MTKQTINVGTSPNDRRGDSLRAAFQKVNANFTELYTSLGLINDANLNLGAFEFNGSVMTTTDSSAVTIDQQVNITSDLVMSGDVVPAANGAYSLGTLERQWKSIHVQGSTIYFNGIPLSVTNDGTIIVNGEVAATPGGDLTWDSIVNKPTTTGSQGITATTDVNGNVNIGFSGQLYTGSSSWSFEEIITGEGEEAVISGKLSLPLITEIAGGDISLTTINLETFNNYIWRFRNDGTLTAPGAIQWDLDANNPGLTDVRINKVGDNLAISTDVILEGPSTWTFTKTGNLNLPRGAVIDTYGDGAGGYTSFSGAPGHYIEVRGKISDTSWSGGMIVHPDGSVDMIAQNDTASASWGFNVDGGLLFPDNSQQTTAFTGTANIARNIESQSDVSIRVNLTDSTQRVWRFGEDGELTLPQGGDILDSTGASVLGGGSTLVNGASTVSLGSDGTLTLPDSATLAVGSEAEIIALTLVYTDYRDQLASYFDSANYTGDGYPASVDSYQQLTESVDPAIQPSWIVLAKAAFDAYEALFIAQQAIDFKIDIYGRQWRFTSDRTNITNSLSIPENTTITGLDNLELTVDGNGGKTAGIELDADNNRVILKTTIKGWIFSNDGDLTLPPGGDILDSNGDSVLGGAAGPVQPYLELTNSPFIIQPVVLGSPVTVSTPGDGSGAQVEVVIGAGPVITSVTVTTPGTNYIVGQRYRVWFYQIGGNNDDSSIEFEVATVSSGGLLTVINAAFTGEAAANTPGTYSNLDMELRASPGDSIGPGLTLVRSYQGALFNIEAETEYDDNNYTSPLGTEWNSDGWGNLTGFNTRTYTTFREALNGAVGNNIIGAELVMHDTINDQYYKFSFSNWGGNNGGSYAYTRTLIERDPNYFKKENYATANNVDVIEDDSTLQIGITRGNNNGIYNPFTEEGWDEDVSPDGTEWNIDGWDDLTDVETRIYTNFYDAYGNGGLGNRVPGSKAVMYVPSIDKYYAIQWLSWTQNNAGGGFSYLRYEIDLTKLDEGVRFADGTVLKTAQGIGRVKLTAPGNRRIEEASGYKSVSVTSRNRTEITGATYTSVYAYELRVKKTTEINAFISPYHNTGTVAVWYISFDNVTFRAATINSEGEDNWMFYYVNANDPTLQVEDAPFYIRRDVGGEPVVWWDKVDLPGGSGNFRGAVIDYHAYTGDGTIIGTIHIVDDDGEEHISHQEVQSGSTDGENDDLWLVTSEGQIRYRRIDGESATLKIHWTAKVFYGSEYYD
jgi:hypothetical protein